jgi:hypothetical protein
MPEQVSVTAKIPDLNKEATISVNCFGKNLEEDRQLVGDEVIASNYRQNVVITIQSGIRRLLKKGLDAAAIQEAYKDYKPGVAVSRAIDTTAAFLGGFGQKTPEEQKALLAQLMELAKQGKK